MRKWIFPLLFLLTVLLLVFLAFLPAFVGMLQDAEVEKTVFHRPVHSITPYLSENSSGLGIGDKLGILQECEVSSIAPAMASLTEEQVRAAVEVGIQPYGEVGIVHLFESWDFHAIPCVAISWQDTQRYFLFWNVTLTEVRDDTKHSLSVLVDDETGNFLTLEWYDPFSLANQPLWEEKWLPLEQFAKIWLVQAGLWDSVRPVLSDFDSQQSVGTAPDCRTIAYTLSDGVECPLNIHFALSGYGEYTMWTQSMPQ